MARTKFTPLDLGLIDEGRFMEQADRDLLDLESRLVKYVDTYGDKARGAKAKITIEISLACEDPEAKMFSVKAQIKKTVPASPANATMAIVAEGEDGQRLLFVRRSGSSADDPAQGKLCTKDGRNIDQETGKPCNEKQGRPAKKK